MIEKWFEPFILLEKQATPDLVGGESVSYLPVLTFQGALSYTTGSETNAAGRFILNESPVLLHEFDVTLSPGDHVRREKTGDVYRVVGSSDALCAPAFSGLHFAQVNVEKAVIPC